MSVHIHTVLIVPDGMSLDDVNLRHYALKVVWRGPGRYAVTDGIETSELNKTDGTWSFIDRTPRKAYRFDSLAEAIAAANKAVTTWTINGKTAAEYLAKDNS